MLCWNEEQHLQAKQQEHVISLKESDISHLHPFALLCRSAVSVTMSVSASVYTSVSPHECDQEREGVRTELLTEWLTAVEVSMSSARGLTRAM